MDQVISLKNGALAAQVLPLGATLSRLQWGSRDLILGFCDPAQHHVIPVYAGHLVGPVANRLSAGRLSIDGTSYQMERNENAQTTLHSGAMGLHALSWNVEEQTDTKVQLRCALADGFGGLPGHRIITAIYSLTPDTLTLSISATTTKTTPMNIAHHPYWALDADLQHTKLWVDADSYLPKCADNTPTGQIQPVAGTALDFRATRAMPKEQDIDHCLCLGPNPGGMPRHVATMISADGLRVDMHTTEAGLQIYDGSGLPARPDITAVPFGLRPFAGLALEPQGWPDAPNHSNFPSILLKSHGTYRQITRYQIT